MGGASGWGGGAGGNVPVGPRLPLHLAEASEGQEEGTGKDQE